MLSDVGEGKSMHSDTEEEFDWEEVEVPEHQHLEITLDAGKANTGQKINKKKGISHAERLTRIDCHKIHTIALISNAWIRNKWLNDPLLHARLISLTPLHLQTAFNFIHKSRVPDQNQRGRMFERAMEQLTKWWAHDFFEVLPEGHIRNHTYEEVQQKLEARGLHIQNEEIFDTATLDLPLLEDIIDEEDAETIRSANSLMKHTLMQSGSRDTSAQLFTALCRGLGIPARLVVSIQSVPWQAGLDKPKTSSQKPKLKGKEFLDTDTNDPSEGDLDDVPATNKKKGKQKAKPAVKLRMTKDKGQASRRELVSPDPLTSPPVFWTEVFSRPDSKWFPIDSIRGIVNKRKVFDPTVTSAGPASPRAKVENRMLYVLAFEEDSYARDVTRRYAKQYAARVAKIQGGSKAPNVGGGGKGRQAWWDRVVYILHRPFRLHRDDLEDQELDAAQMMEGMPTTMSGFKDHPLYVLERHLKQNETLYPPPPATAELGKFRGEPVYPRSAVVTLKTAENWLRSTGRRVNQGEQPMKMVKVRPGTTNKTRELELLKDDLKVAGTQGPGNGEGSSTAANGDVMQGLYAFSQTEAYVADPVIDGVIPKNQFGNIDLYVPSMLPHGGVHIPYKGVAKIAKKLGFDYAEAVIGFEFRKRRAFPVVEGVVVAAENEGTLLDAYWESEKEANERARAKQQERVLKQWTRLIHGLRIRQSLQEQYGSKANERQTRLGVVKEIEDDKKNDDTWVDAAAGGFLAGADRVVTTFHLPKAAHVTLPSPKLHKDDTVKGLDSDGDDVREEPELRTYDLDDGMDVDMAVLVRSENGEGKDFIPKTMQQMAEDVAKRGKEREEHSLRGVESGPKNDEVMGQETSGPGRLTRTRSGAIKRQTILNASREASGKTPRGGRSKSRRETNASSSKATKKRSRLNADISESEETIETSDGVGEETNFAGDDEDEPDIQEEDDEYLASPSKNKRPRLERTRAKATSTPAAVTPKLLSATMNTSPSTRTLRPRMKMFRS